MRIDILTIFPRAFDSIISTSILHRAIQSGLVHVNPVDLRDFTQDRYRTIDDRPYGGGAGMVMKAPPIFAAIEKLKQQDSQTILFSPAGSPLDQQKIIKFSRLSHLILICGHYEGIDERVRIGLVDEEISIGDYILTNGNLPAMVLVDAVVRLLPGVLGCKDSVIEESFSTGLLEYPHYTRPQTFRNMTVPEVLLSGNHHAIKQWREDQAWKRTKENRPDLLDREQ